MFEATSTSARPWDSHNPLGQAYRPWDREREPLTIWDNRPARMRRLLHRLLDTRRCLGWSVEKTSLNSSALFCSPMPFFIIGGCSCIDFLVVSLSWGPFSSPSNKVLPSPFQVRASPFTISSEVFCKFERSLSKFERGLLQTRISAS